MNKGKGLLVNYLSLKPEETQKFGMLFMHSFFVNFFISFYFVPANSVFIHEYGSSWLPYAYMAAGATGYLIGLLYSFLQKRIQGKYLFMGTLGFMLLLPLLATLFKDFFPSKFVAFFMFIWSWPFISLSNMEGGGLTLKMLNLRQVKRLFGFIGIGGIISSIASYFAIPFITPHLRHPYELMYIADIGLVAAIIILFYIYRKFPDKATKETQTKVERSETSFKELFKVRYFRLIFISASLSMIMIYFTDFGYLSSIKVQKTIFKTPADVSNFIAVVCGVFKIGEFIISSFSNRLLSKWGMRVGLVALPGAAAIIVFLSTLAGFGLGTTSLVFFSFMVLNKSSERILRRGLDDPSFNILYQPLEGKQKNMVQTKVGVVQQVSIGIAGVLLLCVTSVLSSNSGFRLQYYTLFFLPLLIAWFWVSKDLFTEYKKQLKQILANMSREKKRETYKNTYAAEMLKKQLNKNDIGSVRISAQIIAETNPKGLDLYAASLLDLKDPLVTRLILSNVNSSWKPKLLQSIDNILKLNNHPEIEKAALQAKAILDANADTKFLDQSWLTSSLLEDKLQLVKFLLKNKTTDDEQIIELLLKDQDKRVIFAAIELIPKRNSSILNARLLELMESKEYYHAAVSALLDIGEKIIPGLETFFKKKTEPMILERIAEIYAKIGSKTAKSSLVKYLDYPNRDVQSAIIRALNFCKYQAESDERDLIIKKLEATIGNILWNYATTLDISNEKNTLKLVQTIELEREDLYDTLFELLSFLYDPKVINLIKKNIIGENTVFAIEIIDNFIDPDIKELIIPLLDNTSENQVIKKFSSIFPQERMSYPNRLKDIMTAHFNKADPWTIAKATEQLGRLHKVKRLVNNEDKEIGASGILDPWIPEKTSALLQKIRKSEMPDEIFLCLYHSDEIVYSTAAEVIYEENPERCYSYLQQLSDNKKKLVDILRNSEKGKAYLLGQKIKLLRRYSLFFTIPEQLLTKLAKLFIIKEMKSGDMVSFFDDGIENIMIVLQGKIVGARGDSEVHTFNADDFIVLGVNAEVSCTDFTTIGDTTVLQASRTEYFNLLADEPGILHHMFEMIQSSN